MKRILGDANLPVVECVNPKYNKFRVRYDYQPNYDENGQEVGVSFLEAEFLHKPSMDEIKDTILNWENEIIDYEILSGFVWRDMNIWLSQENQFNYKAAYDLAVMGQGINLPVVFKFGTTEAPVYYEFKTIEDLTDFYLSAMSYINSVLAAGWSKKDSIDWTKYELWLEE